MTILAVCGPIGSDVETFSKRCLALLNPETTLLIDCSNYLLNNLNGLSNLLNESISKDLIVFGPTLFLNEQLRSCFDIKIFIEKDADLCLGDYMREHANGANYKEMLDHYLSDIKPINDKVKLTYKYANVVLPSKKPSDVLIDMLIRDQQLIKPKEDLYFSTQNNTFWKPTDKQESTKAANPSALSL